MNYINKKTGNIVWEPDPNEAGLIFVYHDRLYRYDISKSSMENLIMKIIVEFGSDFFLVNMSEYINLKK